MDAILLGMSAVAVTLFGGMFVLGRHHGMSIILGLADILLAVLSGWRFRELLIASGKILTSELLGFGYNKQVLAVYALIAAIGALYAIIGAYGIIKDKKLIRR